MKIAKIVLKELVFFARHGLLEEEAKLGQRFRLNVVVELEASLDLAADTPECTVNYVELYATIKEIFTEQRFNMIEAAADAIAVGIAGYLYLGTILLTIFMALFAWQNWQSFQATSPQ